jgi:hypothetical protein
LQRAGIILEKFVDDGAFARTGGLEEGDLLLRLEGDDLAQIVASRTMCVALSSTTSQRVQRLGGRNCRASRALRTRPFHTCARVSAVAPSGFTGTVAVE